MANTAIDLCRNWYRRQPNPLVRTVEVDVYLNEDMDVAADGSVRWAVQFHYKNGDGSLSSVAEQPVQLVPSAYVEDPRLPAYLEAVARALVEIMTTVGTLRFSPAGALSSSAETTDELVREIVRANPQDEWS